MTTPLTAEHLCLQLELHSRHSTASKREQLVITFAVMTFDYGAHCELGLQVPADDWILRARH